MTADSNPPYAKTSSKTASVQFGLGTVCVAKTFLFKWNMLASIKRTSGRILATVKTLTVQAVLRTSATLIAVTSTVPVVIVRVRPTGVSTLGVNVPVYATSMFRVAALESSCIQTSNQPT